MRCGNLKGGKKMGAICPKNKHSKARRDSRRAQWKMTAPSLVKCSKCGALMMPHRVCKSCGSYNKREIIATED
jgi:large subunit ribosomal protein L32